MAGFTTVRDCGAGNKLNLAMRDAIAKGWVIGPRIVADLVAVHGDPGSGARSASQA